jgi:hypothetical protein
MDVSDFFNTVVKHNYREFTVTNDYRLLWNAIVSMNTVAEHVALEQHQYDAQVSRQELARTANQIRNNGDLDDLKFCAEALKHVRKIRDVKVFGQVQGTVTVTSSHVSANDRATWTIGPYDLVDVAQRAFKTLSAWPELS